MAANFGYSEEYVDEKLDMERLFAHLEYIRDNPPAGTLIKAYFEAQSGDSSSTHIQHEAPKTFASEEDKRNYERRQLNNLCADMGVNINQLQKQPKRKLLKVPTKKEGDTNV
jgi:hypothetical protein